MEQAWFEMSDIKRRSINGMAWMPLRMSRKVETGEYGFLGHREEFSGYASIAVPIDAESEARRDLTWSSIGLGTNFYAWWTGTNYVPSDTYAFTPQRTLGLHLVIEQTFDDDIADWMLHQDLIIALGLKKEGDSWVRPCEGFAEIARMLRKADGVPEKLEIRPAYLRDYLCARGMGLLVNSYHSRREIVADAGFIGWENGALKEENTGEEWEGRVSEIHEGGMPFGSSWHVSKISRDDAELQDDVPDLDFNSEAIVAESWERKEEGAKLYAVSGELWKTEWVPPLSESPIVKGDEPPATVYFITDQNQKRENKTTLTGRRWLSFQPQVVSDLMRRRGVTLGWGSRYTGRVGWKSSGLHFGINPVGLVNVFAVDIARLPEWHQQIWAAHSVAPEGGVSQELLDSQMRCEPADTQAPEGFIESGIELVNKLSSEKFGIKIFTPHHEQSRILRDCHRFRVNDQNSLYALAKDLARLIVESLNGKELSTIAPATDKQNAGGSLKALERVLATVLKEDVARRICSPLHGINKLRQADAHLPSSDIDEAIALVNVDVNQPFIHQGMTLLISCVSSIYSIVKALTYFPERV